MTYSKTIVVTFYVLRQPFVVCLSVYMSVCVSSVYIYIYLFIYLFIDGKKQMVGLYYPTNEPGEEIEWLEDAPIVWKGRFKIYLLHFSHLQQRNECFV